VNNTQVADPRFGNNALDESGGHTNHSLATVYSQNLEIKHIKEIKINP